MSIFPTINTALQSQLDTISSTASTSTSSGISYLFDFDTGDYVVRDGKLVEASRQEALTIWIEKILRTQKGKYKVYDGSDYGVNTEDLLFNNNYPVNFIKSELKREIIEALSKNSLIKTVEVTDMTRDKSYLNITINVNGNEVTVSV